MKDIKDLTEFIKRKFVEQNNEITALNQKVDFLNKRLITAVNEAITEKLNKDGFRSYLEQQAGSFVNANIGTVIKDTTENILSRFNKQFKEEAKITKALCGSIDSDIKAVLHGTNMSYEFEKEIRDKIEKTTRAQLKQIDTTTKENLLMEKKEND